MVRCNKIDGRPCKCELSEPRIVHLIQTFIKYLFKLVLDTLTEEERSELRAAARIPHAKIYFRLYLEELNAGRDCINAGILDLDGDMPSCG